LYGTVDIEIPALQPPSGARPFAHHTLSLVVRESEIIGCEESRCVRGAFSVRHVTDLRSFRERRAARNID
jgi:hypothetical protein